MERKRIKLEELRTIGGFPFRDAELDATGNIIREVVKDADGNPVKQIPRNDRGEPFSNVEPELLYQPKTKVLKLDALPSLLKRLYLNIPPNRCTRQDTIYGTRLFQNIAQSKDGYLELDDDVHKWVMKQLTDEGPDGKGIDGVGLGIFGKNLQVVEQAVDNFERPHKSKEAG